MFRRFHRPPPPKRWASYADTSSTDLPSIELPKGQNDAADLQALHATWLAEDEQRLGDVQRTLLELASKSSLTPPVPPFRDSQPQISDEEAVTRHQVAQLESRRTDLQRSIRAHTLALRPIALLPEDVLREIFRHILFTSRCAKTEAAWLSVQPLEPRAVQFDIGRAKRPFTLSSICRRWRDVALTTPCIWSYLGIPALLNAEHAQFAQHVQPWVHRTRLVIERSSQGALDIEFAALGAAARQPVVRALLEMAFKERHRWRTARFVTYHAPSDLEGDVALLLRGLPGELPRLCELVIERYGPNDSPSADLVQFIAPRLQRLRCSALLDLIVLERNFRGLRHVVLSHGSYPGKLVFAALHVVSAAEHLTSLVINDVRFSDPPPLAPPTADDELIEMLTLKQLGIRMLEPLGAQRVLSRLRVLTLDEFVLQFVRRPHSSSAEDILAVVKAAPCTAMLTLHNLSRLDSSHARMLIARSGSSLTTLKLKECQLSEGFLKALHAARDAKELPVLESVEMVRCDVKVDVDVALRRILGESGHTVEPTEHVQSRIAVTVTNASSSGTMRQFVRNATIRYDAETKDSDV
ncbi:hypothetical protein BKA62DRAFT_774050 [Auriculariales sp. MPI-PUGE-AT-0066]|nr:hypothetical protein BKA62DRAFT_774050 [Auriculariales sp. MPI-PUGE-AT-0066]